MSSVMAALAEQGIHADRDGLHVMPPEMLQGAVSMQEECKEFLSKTKQFNDIVGDFIDVMESKSKVIEAEKLRAIGLANRVDHEKEVRKRKQEKKIADQNEGLRVWLQHSEEARAAAEARAMELSVEVAALRHISSRPSCPFDIVVATTKMINGNSLMKSLVEELPNKLVRAGQ